MIVPSLHIQQQKPQQHQDILLIGQEPRGHNFIERRFRLSTVSALGLSPYSLDPILLRIYFYILHARGILRTS